MRSNLRTESSTGIAICDTGHSGITYASEINKHTYPISFTIMDSLHSRIGRHLEDMSFSSVRDEVSEVKAHPNGDRPKGKSVMRHRIENIKSNAGHKMRKQHWR
jgi:hypothetical protein